jgi:DeoR family fructose operon transcriptional repressor
MEGVVAVPLPNASAEERISWLRKQLDASGMITIAAAASALGVSEMTIRRDMAELEERGSAQRVRGGMRAVGPQTFAQRRDRMARAKARVAAKLVDLVPATGAIAIDASSTMMRLAANLSAARDLTVMTNGPETFAMLQQPGISPLLTGGALDSRTGSLIGPLACRAAQQMSVRRFFASAAAVDPASGALEETLDEAEVKRALATNADEVVLGIDSSKLRARALAVGIEWDGVDVLVTELDPDDERLRPFRDLAELR